MWTNLYELEQWMLENEQNAKKAVVPERGVRRRRAPVQAAGRVLWLNLALAPAGVSLVTWC